MRPAILAACALALSILAGCGSAESAAQRQPTDNTSTTLPTPAAVEAQPTLPIVGPTAATQGLPTQETAMPTEPPPTPEEQPPQEQPTTPPRPTAFQATPIAPVDADPTPAAIAPSGAPAPTFHPSLEPMVNQAKADLAQRKSTAVDAIKVVEVQSVTWPDSSLGCPRPGMAYLQVQVDGLLIRLSVEGGVFEYHSGGGKPPFLCEQK